MPTRGSAYRHFVFGVIALLMTLANANHAGIPFLGNHPKVSRHGKHMGIAFAPVTAANGTQLAWSEPWLRHFRFGPFEWLWRVATYRKRQPIRR